MNPLSLVVIGGSAGSLEVLLQMLPGLDVPLAVAIIIVLHRKSYADSVLIDLFSSRTRLLVKEVEEKDLLQPGTIYLAPPDYHLLLESNGSLSLDYSEKINFSRPSIDVTFSSAARLYGPRLLAILLSGANADGVLGLHHVHKMGGMVAVQDPNSAEVRYMPQQAVEQGGVDKILQVKEIAPFINKFAAVTR
ncbi:chemotaxis protein CheB [Chitinophaga costaii]|nr:chemotaxis protein CheB [Chitinophaga costaii]